MKNKIKILGIAPYDGLRLLMEQAALERTDVELVAVNGNLGEGRDIAKAMASEYDVILSRANTADMIGAVTHLPVIDIGISYYDVLCCIKQAKETRTPFAITGFHALTSIARSLCELMEEPIEIFSIDSSVNTEEILNEIRKKGYQTIVCDTVPYPHAKLMGLTPILLTTGMENVNAAIDNAVNQYKNQSSYLDRIAMLQRIISGTDVFTLVMNSRGKIQYSANNLPDSELIAEKIYERIQSGYPDTAEFFLNVKGKMYAVSCDFYEELTDPYYVCHITNTHIPMTYTKYGIKMMNRMQAEEDYNLSFYSTTGSAREIQNNIKAVSQAGGPVMICGERGTGKDKAALLLYASSRLSAKPLYMIDCSLLNERNWNFLISNCHSPFMDNGNTICISGIDAFDKEKQNQLLSIITDTNMHIRNSIILSCSCEYGQQIPHAALRFINMLGCYVLHLPSIREQPDGIRAAAILYLDVLNQQLGKQISSLAPAALDLLMEFPWPLNHVQFQRVLKEIIMLSSAPHVSARTVEQVLGKEAKFIIERPGEGGGEMAQFDLSRSLNQITREIVMLVLKEHDGNQSAAAKQLGIGRTTMWRYLNE